jgi:hypothetical protein
MVLDQRSSETNLEIEIEKDSDALGSRSSYPTIETVEPDSNIEINHSDSDSNQLPVVYAETNLGYSFFPLMKYRILPEPLLTHTLEQLANPISHTSSQETEGSGEVVFECISFQPCQLENAASQDRCTMAEWELGGKGSGRWRFVAVFDGP